jgi:hypothetical protein
MTAPAEATSPRGVRPAQARAPRLPKQHWRRTAAPEPIPDNPFSGVFGRLPPAGGPFTDAVVGACARMPHADRAAGGRITAVPSTTPACPGYPHGAV